MALIHWSIESQMLPSCRLLSWMNESVVTTQLPHSNVTLSVSSVLLRLRPRLRCVSCSLIDQDYWPSEDYWPRHARSFVDSVPGTSPRCLCSSWQTCGNVEHLQNWRICRLRITAISVHNLKNGIRTHRYLTSFKKQF